MVILLGAEGEHPTVLQGRQSRLDMLDFGGAIVNQRDEKNTRSRTCGLSERKFLIAIKGSNRKRNRGSVVLDSSGVDLVWS